MYFFFNLKFGLPCGIARPKKHNRLRNKVVVTGDMHPFIDMQQRASFALIKLVISTLCPYSVFIPFTIAS